MRRLGIFICGLGLLTMCAGRALAADESTNESVTSRKPEASAAFAQLPSRFEANEGQADARVKFLSRGNDHTLFLTPNEAVLALRGSTEQRKSSAVDMQSAGFSAGQTAAPRLSVRMVWVGSNPDPQILGVDELPGKSNYFIGDQSSGWRTQVPLYSKVRYRELYPGVDVLYYGNEGRLEYDLIVSPGADPQKIRLRFRGAKKIRMNAQGDIVLKIGGRSVILHRPVVYQETEGLTSTKQHVEGRYVVKNGDEFGFQIGAYDAARPLVIDPALTYSSFLGGSNADSGSRVAVDSAGNAYIVGLTDSADFPVLNPLQSANKGTRNVFVAKINTQLPGASSLVYSTYLGGAGSDVGRGIAIDSIGNVYIVGDTNSTNFPVTPGAFQPACIGPCTRNAFVAKIDSSGSGLLYSSYLGGSSFDLAFSVALDSASRMYLTGSTTSPDFPTTPGAFQTSYKGGGQFFGDAYVAVVNPTGNGASDLNYSTYIGGSNQELAWGLAVDNLGFVYVTGSTLSTDFPVTPAAFQSALGGVGNISIGDGFLVKLNPGGLGASDLIYSTYFGGSNDERGESVAVDSSGFAYVVGWTTSANFPVTSSAYQPNYATGTCNAGQCADAIIMKWDLRASGANSLLYSTFLGGSGFDLGHAIAVDSNGIVYATGGTGSNDFPLVNPIQTTCGGGCPNPVPDVFISKLDVTKSGSAALLFSTYLGGSLTDTGQGIAIDPQGNAYVTGQVFSNDFPTVMPFQAFCKNCSSSSDDGFLAKVCITACPSSAVSTPSLAFGSQTVGSASSSQPVLFSNPGTGVLTIISITAPAGFRQTNSCGVVLSAGSLCTINVNFNPQSAGPASGSLNIASNASATPATVSLTGTGVVVTLAASPGGLTYVAQQVGTASASQPVTLSNPGGTSISITGIQASGDFAQTNNCGASVAANSSCTVNVTFTPTASGSRTGTLTITDAASNSPQSVSLTGSGIAPTLSLSTTSLYFGTKVVGTSSPAGTVTLSNSGSVPVTISSIQTTASDYLQTNNCGTSLNAGSNCVVNVVFQPTTFGSRSGSLVITDNAAGSPQNVSFTGTGTIAQTSVGWSVAFGSTVVGTSVNQSFTITDVGTVPLTIGSLSISDLNAADFSQTNNCAASITPGGFCTVTVAFTPSATGLRIATLIIPEDGGGVALGLNLSGTGTSTAGGPPALSSLILGPVGAAGSSSYQGTVTLWSAAPGGGALVTLSSDNPSVASVPSSVLVPATATAITFSVPTANVSASSTAAISATYGSFTLSSSLTLIPPAITVTPRSSVLTFNQTQQFQAVGSNIANNNVTWSVDGIQGGNSQVGILSPSGLYTPPALVGSHTITAVSQLDSSLNGVAQVYVTNYGGIFTQHNDNFRSGQNLQETVLTPSNVNPVQFGKLYSVPVDGSVYAQPLYVPNLLIPGQGSHNVVFVVTEHDSVYAFDADTASSAPLWHASFINPSAGITTLPPQDIGGGPIGGEVGITGTPVIDPGTGTMFVAAITKETGKYFWRLHALNIATGAEKPGSPVVISGEVSGTGVGTDGTNVAFDPLWHLNRPGLLELNGVVYVAFGSEGDLGQWHGWLFAFDASTLNLLSVFCTTPNGSDGAVWQGGGGLAADSLGNIYFTTGNGTFDANIGGSDYSDSVLKIKLQTSGLAVLDYFTPYDQAVLAFNDEDLGSGGPLLLSDQPGSFPHLLTVAGKGGTLYLINRDNLGKFQSGSDSQIVQSIRAEFPASSEIGVFGIPAEWNGQVFYQSEGDTLKAFALSNGMLPNPPQKGPDVFGDRGASPSISASGTSNGIVWVLQQDAWSTNGPSILHAYSASNIQQELYTSGQVASRDQAGVAVRFSVPTVANGRVFVGGGFSLTVYAPLP